MQFQQRTGPIVNDAAPFEPAMVQGWHADSPRLFSTRLALGLQIAQPTHTPAPFSVEMTAGWHPDTPRLPFVAKLGWSDSQTSPVSAPFSVEMTAGNIPLQSRSFIERPTGWQSWPLDEPFSIEMVAGWHPDTNRAYRDIKIGWNDSPSASSDLSFVPFSLYGLSLILSAWELAKPPVGRFAVPPVVAPATVAPNLSCATAIDIGTVLPYSTTQNVNVGGTTQTVYYQYTAQPGDVVIGIFGFGDLVTYKPTVSITSAQDPNIFGLGIVATNKPLQFPVIAGATYCFKIASSTGNVASAVLQLSVRRAPNNPVPPGSILIIDDTDPVGTQGFPGAVLSATDGTILRFFYPFASGTESTGDILNTGLMDFVNNAVSTLYNPDGTLNVISTLGYTGPISSNKQTTFYPGNAGSGGAHASVTTLSSAGVQGPTTWTFAQAGLAGLAINPTETIAYYTGQGGSATNSPIQRWDLVNNVALSNLVGGVASYDTGDLVALSDGTILAMYYQRNVGVQAIHYSAAGATLNTYTLTLSSIIPRMCRGIDDPVSFWVYLPLSTGFVLVQHIKVSDGTILTAFTIPNFETGVYLPAATATPSAFFGPSQSCPILVLQAPITNAPCVSFSTTNSTEPAGAPTGGSGPYGVPVTNAPGCSGAIT